MIKSFILVLTLPALIQPAFAQEHSRAQQTLISLFATVGSYVETIGALKDEKLSPEEAAQKIIELRATLDELRAVVEAMPEKEKEELYIMMTSPQFKEGFSQIDQAMEKIDVHLLMKKHYDSPALKAACDAFRTK